MLRWLHLVVFLMFFVQAVLTHFSRSSFSEFKIDFPHSQSRIKANVKNLTAAYFTLVAFHHLAIQHPLLYRHYKLGLSRGRNVYRWVEYALTSSTMIVIMAILCGITDVVGVSMLFFNMILVILSGAWAEFDLFKSWFPHFSGWVLHMYIWGTLFSRFFNFTGDHRTYKLLSVLLPLMFVLFSMFGVVQLVHLLRIGPFKRYVIIEVFYVTLSVVTKTTMGFMVLHTSIYLSP